MTKEEREQKINIPSKLQNKSEAYIRMTIAKENRKKYLNNFIEDLNKELDDAMELGCNFIEKNIGILSQQVKFMGDYRKLIPHKCFNVKEINQIVSIFNQKGYNVDYHVNDLNYQEGYIRIAFIPEK